MCRKGKWTCEMLNGGGRWWVGGAKDGADITFKNNFLFQKYKPMGIFFLQIFESKNQTILYIQHPKKLNFWNWVVKFDISSFLYSRNENLSWNLLPLSHDSVFFYRKQYQATFKFCWNIDSGRYFVVDSDSLKEISAYKVLILPRSDLKFTSLKTLHRKPVGFGTQPDVPPCPSWKCSSPPPAPSGSSPMSPWSGASPWRPSLIPITWLLWLWMILSN